MNKDRFNIVIDTKKFVLFINKIIVNYPKREYILKNKLEETSYEILELIYYTNLIDDRLNNQKLIISKISMLDFYLEVSYNNKCITEKVLNQGSRKLEDIKKMMYGWVATNES